VTKCVCLCGCLCIGCYILHLCLCVWSYSIDSLFDPHQGGFTVIYSSILWGQNHRSNYIPECTCGIDVQTCWAQTFKSALRRTSAFPSPKSSQDHIFIHILVFSGTFMLISIETYVLFFFMSPHLSN